MSDAEEEAPVFVAADAEQPLLSDLLPAPPSNLAPHFAAVIDSTGDIVIDDRTRRMLEAAIRSFRVVVLVGAPGTGKGTLLQEVIADVRARPHHYGFGGHEGSEWPAPVKRTPDDSWSSFELIGGFAPGGEAGTLRWMPGLFLDAIRDDRWVILDEINRGEMDKILGPLLTWLAGETVSVGRVDASPASGEITLGWTAEHQSETTPSTGVVGASTGDDVSYRAGADWRLLGTYNPQDADRVFGMGQALGRRMKIIPLPLLPPGDLRALLATRLPALPATMRSGIADLYQAHYATDGTELGPALFLDVARYVSGASASAEDSADDDGSPSSIDEPEEQPSLDDATAWGTESGDEFAEGDEESQELRLSPSEQQVLAEGYLIAAGRFLSRYRDEAELRDLGENSLVRRALGDQWAWISQRIQDLR